MNWIWNKLFKLSFWGQKQKSILQQQIAYWSCPELKPKPIPDVTKRFTSIKRAIEALGIENPRKAAHLQEIGVKGPTIFDENGISIPRKPKVPNLPPVKNKNEMRLIKAQAQYSTGGYALQTLANEIGMSRGKLTRELRKRGVTICPRGRQLTNVFPFPLKNS